MFSLYQNSSEYNKFQVSRTTYEKIFHQLNLSFKKPKKDTCSKCDVYNTQLRVLNGEEYEEIQRLQKRHQEEADFAYEVKRRDVEKAKLSKCHKTLIFDLQQCLPTPMLTADVSFYKLKLWTYNLTVHDFDKNKNKSGIAYCYMWHEAISGRGANQIASCIYRHIMNLPNDIKSVTLFSDTCGGQNKNSHFAAMLMYAIDKNSSLEYIEHKFLVPGHTHMECDQDHSIIERQKTKCNFSINHPYDWYRLVESCGKKTKFIVKTMELSDILDFASILKGNLIMRKINENGGKVNWRNIKWLKVEKGKKGIMLYKETLEEGDDFQEINCRRKKKDVHLNLMTPNLCSHEMVPISVKKKQHLLELCNLNLVDRTFHEFYKNLITDERPVIDPDLVEDDSSED